MKAFWICTLLYFAVIISNSCSAESTEPYTGTAEVLKALALDSVDYRSLAATPVGILNGYARIEPSARFTENGRSIANGDSWTVLTAAIEAKNEIVASYLLGRGVDINRTTKFGYSPCWLACDRVGPGKDLAFCELLLGLGANTESTPTVVIDGPVRQTALHRAVVYNNVDLVDLLVKYGANIAAMDSDNKTPILRIADPVNDGFTEFDEESAHAISRILRGDAKSLTDKTKGNKD